MRPSTASLQSSNWYLSLKRRIGRYGIYIRVKNIKKFSRRKTVPPYFNKAYICILISLLLYWWFLRCDALSMWIHSPHLSPQHTDSTCYNFGYVRRRIQTEPKFWFSLFPAAIADPRLSIPTNIFCGMFIRASYKESSSYIQPQVLMYSYLIIDFAKLNHR